MIFDGYNVIVSGGSSGIGFACVQKFASLGACVLNADRAAFTQEALNNLGPSADRVAWVEADMGVESDVQRIVPHCSETFGDVDILVNNAAYVDHKGGSIGDTDSGEWRRQLDVTVTGTYLLSQAAIESMRRTKRGVIVNIASIGGILPFASAAAYSVAKASILQLTRAIAIDYGRLGIRCNAVAPGPIDTPTFASIKQIPAELADREARTAIGRIGLPREVATAVAFLASDDASFITGVTIPVDGGWSAYQWNPNLGPRDQHQ